MIDDNARQKLINRNSDRQLSAGLNGLSQQLQLSTSNQQIVNQLIDQISQLNARFESQTTEQLKQLTGAFAQNKLTTEQLNQLKVLTDEVKAKMAVFDEIKAKIDAGQTILFPKETQLSGEVAVSEVKKLPAVELKNLPKFPAFPQSMEVYGGVEVSKLPPVEVSNLGQLNGSLEALFQNFQTSLTNLISSLPKPEVNKKSGPVEIKQWTNLLDEVTTLKAELVNGFNLLIKYAQESRGADPNKPMAVEIIADRIPRPVTNPVTNMSINGLGGVPLSTTISVTSAATALPATNLANRRSLMVFNNDGSKTLYLGGADVTTSNGLPILAQSYSPVIDAGVNMTVYGIVSTGSVDVRVLELSDIKTGR